MSNQTKHPTPTSEAATSAWLASGGDGRVTLHSLNTTTTTTTTNNNNNNNNQTEPEKTADVGSSRPPNSSDGTTTSVSIGVNAYGTSTSPRPNVIERSSCTSSSPRLEAFAYADGIRKGRLGLRLEQVDGTMEDLDGDAKAAVAELVEENRARLAKVLGLDQTTTPPPSNDATRNDHHPHGGGVSIIMTASGTDAELIAALAALSTASPTTLHNVTHTPATQTVATSPSLLSILMPGTGSGVGDAAGMRHHSAAAPQLHRVQPGEVLEGVLDGCVVAVEPAKDGVDLSDAVELGRYIDDKQRGASSGGTNDSTAPHVLLHAVAGSKTGLHHPPITVIDTLLQNRPNTTVIIDACQMRVTPSYIRTQLSKGYVVLLTGSKFYGGPPFAGACLLPPSIAAKMEAMAGMGAGTAIPKGLGAYFTRDDVPKLSMPTVRETLPSTPNPGLALRWATSLHTMERYHALPQVMTERIAKRWVARVKALAEGFYPAVEVLEVGVLGGGESQHRIGRVNTIISLMVRTGGGREDGADDEGNGGSSSLLLNVRGLKRL